MTAFDQNIQVNIKEAAKLLKASEKTLRRWEARGILIPLRTSGGHRRYDLRDLKKFKVHKKSRRVTKRLEPNLPIQDYSPQIPFKSTPTYQNIINAEIADNTASETLRVKKILSVENYANNDSDGRLLSGIKKEHHKLFPGIKAVKFFVLAGLVFTLLYFVKPYLPSYVSNRLNYATKSYLLEKFAKKGQETNSNKNSQDISTREQSMVSRVLAITSLDETLVNIAAESIFREIATFEDNVAINGNVLTVGTGTPDLIDENGGDAFVTDDLEVDGTVFVGTLSINADDFTDLTGTGLQIAAGALQTTLGTSITGSEIEDGSINEVDLNASNTASGNQILSYNSSTGGFTWVGDSTNPNYWTDDGSLVYLTTTTDNLTLGSSTELAKFGIDGDTDEIQFLVQGHSTQTTSLAVFENSSGTDRFAFTNLGNITFSPSTFASSFTLYSSATSFSSGDTAIIDAINTAYNAATGGSGGAWSISSGIIYPTSATNDLAIGGSTLTASVFAIDESAATFYFGYDNSANPTLEFEATDGDAGTFGFNTSDSFYITGATMAFGGNVTAASGTNISPAVDLGADLGTSSIRWNNLYVANINSNAGLDVSGQAIFTYEPTDTTYGESSIMINPTAPVANGYLLGIGFAGSQKAGIDEDGDFAIGYSNGVNIGALSDPLNVYGHSTTRVFGIDTSGNMTTSDNAWLGLGSSSGRIEFDDQSTDEINILSANVGIGDTSPDALFDIDSTATTGIIAGITSTTLTTGEIWDITATYAPTDGSTNEGLDLNITHSPTTLADNFSSINLTTTDGTALGNTVYGLNNTITLTGNAAKTGIGLYSTVTSSSTTGDTLIALDLAASATGALSATQTRTIYGLRSQPASTAATANSDDTLNLYGSYLAPSSTLATAGTTNVYGSYITTTATHAANAGTINQYGLYVVNGTSGTNGTSTKYGLYVEDLSGADTQYAAIFAGADNVGIGTTTPDTLLTIRNASSSDVSGIKLLNDINRTTQLQYLSSETWLTGSDGVSIGNGIADAQFATSGGFNGPILHDGVEIRSADDVQAVVKLIGTLESDWYLRFLYGGSDLVSAAFNPVANSNGRMRLELYNTLEATPTNYERLAVYADSSNNVFRIDAQNGGSGTLRNITLQGGGGNVGINDISPDALFDIDSAATTTDISGILASALTTGKVLTISSTSNALDSAVLLNVAASTTAATDTSLSADIANLSFSPIYSTAVTSPTVSGNVVDISRSVTTNSSFASTLALTGAVVAISDSATATTGSITSTANVLDITQNYTSATGTALYVKNYGATSSESFRVDDSSGDSTPFVIDGRGNVGIGDPSPDAFFEIESGATTGNTMGIVAASQTTGDIIDLTGTYAPSGGETVSAVDINLTNNPSTTANTLRGIDMFVDDDDSRANTLYGIYSVVDNAGNTSTGTHSIYGGYFQALGKTAGTTTGIGLYSTASGADTNYAGVFENTSTAGTALTAGLYINNAHASNAITDAILIQSTGGGAITTGLDFDDTDIVTDIELQNGEIIQNDVDGTVLIDDSGGTDLLSISTTAFTANLDDTATYTETLCHSGADGATGVVNIGDCNVSGGGADLAEYFGSDGTLEAGDVVMMDPVNPATTVVVDGKETTKAFVVKTGQSQEQRVIGIVSTNPHYEVLGSEIFTTEEQPVPIALAGRAPVKVSTENGPITVGDPLTSSSIPGIAMKATTRSPVIGKALQSFNGSEIGKISTFVNVSWYDPEIYLTDTGNLNITGTEQSGYVLADTSGNAIEKIAGFRKILAANLRAGYAEISSLASDLIRTDRLEVNNIASNSDNVTIDLFNPNQTFDSQSGFGKLLIKGKDDEVVASVDAKGDAEFAGKVSSDDLEVTNNATIAGELRVGKIYADEVIAGNQQSLTLDQIEELLQEAEVNQDQLSEASNWNINTATNSANLKELALENLFVTETAAVNSLSVTNSVVIGNDLVISAQNSLPTSQNSIDTLSAPLSLQSSASQPLYIMAGLVKIDTDGNVEIAGDLAVGGTIKGSGLELKADPESGFGKILSIIDSEDNEVAVISASGSAQFKNLTTERISVTEDPSATTSATLDGIVYTTQASAGTAKVPVGSRDVIIKNPLIKANGLVFITLTSPIQNNTIYVKEQKDGEIKVGFDQAIPSEAGFNWWLVDLVTGI